MNLKEVCRKLSTHDSKTGNPQSKVERKNMHSVSKKQQGIARQGRGRVQEQADKYEQAIHATLADYLNRMAAFPIFKENLDDFKQTIQARLPFHLDGIADEFYGYHVDREAKLASNGQWAAYDAYQKVP